MWQGNYATCKAEFVYDSLVIKWQICTVCFTVKHTIDILRAGPG